MGRGQEVYPSQELVLDTGTRKSKILYEINNKAGMHSQKSAMRFVLLTLGMQKMPLSRLQPNLMAQSLILVRRSASQKKNRFLYTIR
ncbi:CRISPR-associated protein [Actinobacillus equuli]|nr:CRISPR-associated protein [Actinobacillus equuli]